MHFQESMIDELAECIPVVPRVLHGISERGWIGGNLLLVKPALEVIQDWSSEPLPESNAVSFWKGDCQAIDFEHAFDHSQGVVGKFPISLFGNFKISVDMGPAVCGSSANAIFFDIGEHLVVDGCAVGEQEAQIAWQGFLMIVAFAVLSEIVEIVGCCFVTAIDGNLAFDRFAGAFTDEGHGRLIGFNHPALENASMHALVENAQLVCRGLEPAAHGGAANGNAVAQENALLAVQGQMVVQLGLDDVGDEAGCGIALINWFERLGSSDYMPFALEATVGVFDVFDPFVACRDVIQLVRNSEADGCAHDVTARAEKGCGIVDSVLLCCLVFGSLWCLAATAATFRGRSLWEPGLFSFNCLTRFFVHLFSFTIDIINVDAAGGRAVDGTVAPPDLFLQFKDAVPKLDQEFVACRKGVWQRFRQSYFSGIRCWIAHGLLLRRITIFYSKHRIWYR